MLNLDHRINASDNFYLKRLVDVVQLYNSSPVTNQKYRIQALDTIMAIAGEYLTSKPPKGLKVKNVGKWDALRDLAGQCAIEAQNIGVKQLTTPTDFRLITRSHANQSYWLERLDPLRRPGYWLSGRYEQWLTTYAYGNTGDFWTFLAGIIPQDDVTHDNLQVKLLDESMNAKRIKYLAACSGDGKIYDLHKDPFTTYGMETAASGANWGIFVLSCEGLLYLHSHKVGRFHHSTFLGGGAVAAAGEMVVDDVGTIRVITAKTGHYRAGVEEMRRLVNTLPIRDDAIILPDVVKTLSPPQGLGHAIFYQVGDFRKKGIAAAPLTKFTVKLRTPIWAVQANSKKAWFDKVP